MPNSFPKRPFSQVLTFPRLAPVSIGANITEKLLVAALPLFMASIDASPLTISVLVTVQAAAWLVASLPAGALTDRMSRATLAMIGGVMTMIGALLAGLTLAAVTASTPWTWGTLGHGLGLFLASSGVVVQALAFFALLPSAVADGQLSKANGLMETIAAGLTVAAPFVVGHLIENRLGRWTFAIAGVGGLLAFLAASRLPRANPILSGPPASKPPMFAAMREGARFVINEPILRAIALCAFAWNCAFVALNAYFPIWAKSTLGWTIAEAGVAVGGYGAGGLIGAYSAHWVIRRFGPAFVFVLGPLGSTLGALMAVSLSPVYGPKAGFIGFMILGSTAMMWLVLQTTVRQLVTPPQLLGRVAATLTTAIYGIRPFGAQLAGVVAVLAAPEAALWLAVGLFAFSAVVIALSAAAQLEVMPEAAV